MGRPRQCAGCKIRYTSREVAEMCLQMYEAGVRRGRREAAQTMVALEAVHGQLAERQLDE